MKFEEFFRLHQIGSIPIAERQENERAWKVNVKDVLEYDEEGRIISVDLDIKNPNSEETLDRLPPEEIANSVIHKEHAILELVEEVRTECLSVYKDTLRTERGLDC